MPSPYCCQASYSQCTHWCKSSSGSSGRVGEGPRNMKFMRPSLVAIFVWLIFTGRGGGGGSWPPWICYWSLDKNTWRQISDRSTVEDPGFSWGGGAPTPKVGVLTYFFDTKLHENERIWTPRGAHPLRPLGSATDLHSQILDSRPLYNFLHFHAVFGKFWPNSRLAPPLAMAPPLENPGSGAANVTERWEGVADPKGWGAPTNELLFNFMSFIPQKTLYRINPLGDNL